MARKFSVHFPVFNGACVHVEFTPDIAKSMQAHRATREVKYEDEYALTVCCYGGSTIYLFFPLDASAGVIAHEAWHAVRRLMMWTGIEVDNEVVAYHLGYLVDKIVERRRNGRKQ